MCFKTLVLDLTIIYARCRKELICRSKQFCFFTHCIAIMYVNNESVRFIKKIDTISLTYKELD